MEYSRWMIAFSLVESSIWHQSLSLSRSPSYKSRVTSLGLIPTNSKVGRIIQTFMMRPNRCHLQWRFFIWTALYSVLCTEFFSCPGSSIPTLGRQWLSATLEFRHKKGLLRLLTFDQRNVRTKRQTDKKTNRQKDNDKDTKRNTERQKEKDKET